MDEEYKLEKVGKEEVRKGYRWKDGGIDSGGMKRAREKGRWRKNTSWKRQEGEGRGRLQHMGWRNGERGKGGRRRN